MNYCLTPDDELREVTLILNSQNVKSKKDNLFKVKSVYVQKRFLDFVINKLTTLYVDKSINVTPITANCNVKHHYVKVSLI